MAAQAVDFTLSGHVNRALFITDSDGGTQAEVSDNGGSGTRFRMNGKTELEDGNTVAIQFEYGAGSTVSLRHANVQYGGEFGRITVGQGSEAADGSAYSDTTGVFGIGHGAGTGAGFSLGDYFGSLDAGGRVEMIRYDSPSIGPMGAAVSVANGDRVSAQIKLSSEFSGTSFGGKIATLQEPGSTETVGASFGATLASGLTISGAWARGNDHSDADCGGAVTDPSYFQAEVGYKFGNSGVAASWWSGEDFCQMDTESTMLGIGVRHTLPKAGAEIYSAVQNYDVEMMDGMTMDETVFVVGTRVMF